MGGRVNSPLKKLVTEAQIGAIYKIAKNEKGLSIRGLYELIEFYGLQEEAAADLFGPAHSTPGPSAALKAAIKSSPPGPASLEPVNLRTTSGRQVLDDDLLAVMWDDEIRDPGKSKTLGELGILVVDRQNSYNSFRGGVSRTGLRSSLSRLVSRGLVVRKRDTPRAQDVFYVNVMAPIRNLSNKK